MEDLISRKSAIEAINGMIDRFERILADIRESKGDDSVCGMCEYDGAYMGQSGDWCNECPGFDKDDCFKLSDKCRKRWIGDIVLPLAAPSTAHTTETTAETTAPSTDDWIPCSEGLPERADNVIICYKAGDYTLVSTGRYLYKFKMWYVDVVGDLRDGVTAWMPLPEPYRGGEKE